MRRLLAMLCVLALASCVVVGCGSEETPEKEAGAAGHPEEVVDTTRLDSAVSDTAAVDTAAEAVDTGQGQQ